MALANALTLLEGALLAATTGLVTYLVTARRFEAENRRLREERGAVRWDQRRAVYVRMVLTSTRLMEGDADLPGATRAELLADLREQYADVSVNGTDKVCAAAAGPLYAAHRDEQDGGGLERLHANLVEAMRSDVAPRPIK